VGLKLGMPFQKALDFTGSNRTIVGLKLRRLQLSQIPR